MCMLKLKTHLGLLAPPFCSLLQALVKFNEALAYNKEQRKTIDNLRRERFVRRFDTFVMLSPSAPPN